MRAKNTWTITNMLGGLGKVSERQMYMFVCVSVYLCVWLCGRKDWVGKYLFRFFFGCRYMHLHCTHTYLRYKIVRVFAHTLHRWWHSNHKKPIFLPKKIVLKWLSNVQQKIFSKNYTRLNCHSVEEKTIA